MVVGKLAFGGLEAQPAGAGEAVQHRYFLKHPTQVGGETRYGNDLTRIGGETERRIGPQQPNRLSVRSTEPT